MKIVEDNKTGIVDIDGHKIDGFIDNEICLQCAEPKIYSDAYDAYFCASCNVWLEPRCGDKYCQYCAKRPDEPLPVKS